MSRLPCQPGKGRAGFGGSDGLSEKSGDGVASKSNDLEISVIVPVRPGEIQLNRCLTALFDALPSTSQSPTLLRLPLHIQSQESELGEKSPMT